jgi:hypothetical protein
MLRIDQPRTPHSARLAPEGIIPLKARMLTETTRPQLTEALSLTPFAGLASSSKEELEALLRGHSPQDLQAMRKLYLAQNGVSLDQVIDRQFSSEDKVELKALAQHGRVRDSDALESALIDDQNDKIHRLLKRRTARELDVLRSEYKGTYGKDPDSQVLENLKGKDRQLAQVLLTGEPEARPGESREALATRKGDYISKQLEISLRHDPMEKTNPKRILDALHDHSPEALEEAGRLYKERTGNELRDDLKSGLTGANEDLALNYLDDGKESPIEKLRRAFDGNNDEELIRRTLRDLTAEQRKELGTTHKSEVSKLFDQLNDEETVEMKALLGKGKLDNADRLKIAVADGNDKGIVRALKGMSAEERQALAQDKGGLSATLEKLDDDERGDIMLMLTRGRMSAAGELRHAETPNEVYGAAAWAKKTGETGELNKMMALGPYGTSAHKVEVSMDRFKAHLEKGELSASERVILENDEDRMKATLRAMSAKELKEVAASPKALENLDDELGKESMAEVKQLIARGPLPAHESLRHAVIQEDEKRINQLLAELQDDKQRTELLSKYRTGYRKELANDLRDVLSSDDLRKADNALRLQARDGSQVAQRTRDDMFADRDDNSLSSKVSNELLDAFSSAGQNMDDQARETEAKVRAHRRSGEHGIEELRAKESSFQGSREQMHVERQQIAGIAVGVVSGIVTGGLGGLSMSAGMMAHMVRASWAVRGATAAGVVSTSAGTRLAAEKLFRGNDFGTPKDIEKASLVGAVDGAGAMAGGLLGRAAMLGQSSKAAELTGNIVKDAIKNGGGYLGNPELAQSREGVASFLITTLGGGLAGGVSTKLEAVMSEKSMFRKALKFVVPKGADLGIGQADEALRGTLVNEVQ